ncbi:O-antigen ligase [Thalassobacter sp. 16PALIMAR09]|uniref:O-antigen ligase family protein n=1 Tax=Thalassobacter sp. 16PALIMAR09 TaxID=1225651 RepID=UPI00051D3073|nr:O-antigen ligase family protein [Thalassobacter sp. 16PALIMAR09]KGK99998.1 hypothetical protein PM04_16645 [Thalassobacter sp. 16PALIMAR09]
MAATHHTKPGSLGARLILRSLVMHAVAFAYVVPISVTVAQVGDKPVDFVPSDAFWLLLPVALAMRLRLPKTALNVAASFTYFLTIGMLGSIMDGGALGPILSALSYMLPACHIVVGALLWKRVGVELLTYLARAILITVLVLFASDVVYGMGIRGCGYEGRWGGCFGKWELYGFPNSAMNFIALMLFLPACLWSLKTPPLPQWLMAVTGVAAIIILSLSLSRSAFLVLGMLAIVGFLAFSRLWAFAAVPILGIAVTWSIDHILAFPIFTGLVLRMRAAIAGGDITTGRVDIWGETLDLISMRPFFGYMFQFFSDFSQYGTPHQQILEVFFKAGLFGAIIYLGPVVIAWSLAYRMAALLAGRKRKTIRLYLTGFFAACFTSMLVLPILSYATMANVVFMLVGAALQARTEEKKQ